MKTDNKLQVIIKESGLKTTKAKVLLDNFKDYFDIAAEWEIKAKGLLVTKESQVADMKMARVGRLFLREKRIAIENTRKKLKEQALREGKAIDGIANVLKAVIVPIEEYLNKQEKFVEIRAAEIAEQRRIEAERLLFEKEEVEKIAREKAEAEERERIRKENERLKTEAIIREKEAVFERKRQAEILTKQREKAEAERRATEEMNRIEREKQERILAKEREQVEVERKKVEESHRQEMIERDRLEKIARDKRIEAEAKAKRERELLEKIEKDKQAKIEARAKEERRKLEEKLKEAESKKQDEIECPFCHKKFKLIKETRRKL